MKAASLRVSVDGCTSCKSRTAVGQLDAMLARMKASGMMAGGGEGGATADSSKVVPLEAAHVPKEGGTVQRTKSKAGSLWGKLRQNTVKETPKIINFAETVRALAAKKYEEELDSLCDLFNSHEMFSTGKVTEVPTLHNQNVRSRTPDDARPGKNAKHHEVPVRLGSSRLESSSSSESEDDEAYWRNRRQGLGGLVRAESSGFIPMSDTPPPEPKNVVGKPPTPPPPLEPEVELPEVQQKQEAEQTPAHKVTTWKGEKLKVKPLEVKPKAQNIIRKLEPGKMKLQSAAATREAQKEIDQETVRHPSPEQDDVHNGGFADEIAVLSPGICFICAHDCVWALFGNRAAEKREGQKVNTGSCPAILNSSVKAISISLLTTQTNMR